MTDQTEPEPRTAPLQPRAAWKTPVVIVSDVRETSIKYVSTGDYTLPGSGTFGS